MIRAYDFHPPDDVRLYEVPAEAVLRLDTEMFAIETRHGETMLRHYAFRDHWFKINYTTDLAGAFVETTRRGIDLPFAFKCDITTPMLCRDKAVYAVDLWLDVFIRGDGVTHAVYDEDDFAHAMSRGWLSQRESGGARSGLEELIGIIKEGAFLDFVTKAHPVIPSPPQTDSPPGAIPATHLAPSEVPLLHPHRRPSW